MIGAYANHLGFAPEPLVQHYARFLPRSADAQGPRIRPTARPFGSAEIISFPLVWPDPGIHRRPGGIVACLPARSSCSPPQAVYDAASAGYCRPGKRWPEREPAHGTIQSPGAATRSHRSPRSRRS